MKQQHKFTEIENGEISEDWDIKPAEMFCSRVTDGTHDSPKKQEQGKYLITSRHLKDGYLDFSNAYYIKEEDFIDANRRSKVDRWDVLFSMIGTIGEVYLEKADKIGYAIKNVGLFKSGGEELKGKWIFYYLRSKEAKEYIRKSRAGTTQEYITLDSLRKFPICFPKDENEMQQIVNILDSIQDKLEICKQINITLEKIGQALFKHWFIDFEFPNENGKPYKSSGGEMVDSDLGEIPEGWRMAVLPKVSVVVDCLHTKKPEMIQEGRLLLQVYNIATDGTLDFTEKYPVSEGDYQEWIRNIEVKEGDCLITNAGRVGAVGQVPMGFKGGIGRNITAIRPVGVTPAYLFRYLFSSYGLGEIGRQTDQGTVLDSLNVKGVKKIRILIPLRAVMDKFEEIARPLREKVERNKSENDYLVAIRDSLLPRLMSGQIRVPAG